MYMKCLSAIALLMIEIPALAGQIKFHEPVPTKVQEVDVCKIDVVMDVGYYVQIVDQNPIIVTQDSTSSDPYHTYVGCKKTEVKSNFAAQLFLSAVPKSNAGGNWSAWAAPSLALPGTNPIDICVKGTHVAIEQLINAKNLTIAEVTVKVLPAG